MRNFVTDETIAHVTPKIRSADVDTELDLLWCEHLLNQPDGEIS
jgi:CMP-N-acetylneuraminic acid synthetase